MLCGEPPFVAPEPGDLMMMQMTAAPTPPSIHRRDVPGAVEQIILKMLAKRRDDRFNSMAAVGTALGYFATPTLPSLTPPPSRAIVVSAEDRKALDEMHRGMLAVGPHAGREMSSAPPPTSLDHTTDFGPTDTLLNAPRAKRGPVAAGILAGLAVLAALVWMRSGTHDAAVVAPVVVGPAAAKPESTPPPPGLPIAPPAIAESPKPAAAPSPIAGSPAPSAQHPSALMESSLSPRRTPPPSRRPAAPPAPPKAVTPGTPTNPSEVTATANPTAGTSATAEPGFLSFDSMPWSEVYLGNKLLGTTPLIRISLPPGRHVLTLKNPEVGTSTSYVVEIASGKSVSRFVGWEKE
jgi:hypothetical protein